MLKQQEDSSNKNPQSNELLTHEPSISIWKRIALFGTSMFFMLIFPLIAYAFVIAVPQDQKSMAINYICYGVMFVAMFLIIVVDIPKYVCKFKDYKNYIIGFGMGVFLILFDIAYINLVKLHPAYAVGQNETTVRSTITIYPALAFIFLGLIGPIAEELAHRAGVFKALSKVNIILAYIVSSIIFAFLHFGWSNPNYIAEWLNFPLYFVSGLVLAFTYDKFSIVGSCT